MAMTLAEIAERCQATLRGDPQHVIDRVAALDAAGPRDLAFVVSDRYLERLASVTAGVVVLGEADAGRYHGNVLISGNPRLCFTRAARLLHPLADPVPGCHPSAVVGAGAYVDASAEIGAQVVVESGATIGARVVIAAGVYVGREAVIGDDSRIHPHVTVGPRCIVGRRCMVHAGAVIGSDGFGYARDGVHWEKTPQLGRVVIGDDVEIGANTTIDRGALGDTVIGRGVKLDNLIQIAHNVEIGDDTAIAACVGIAGSTKVGKRCTIAGQVGIVGHIEIADDVQVTGATVVSHTIREPGTYSSGTPLESYQSWLKNAVRMRQLDDMARRLKRLEQKIAQLSEGGKLEGH
jgi:UDP-3-O-[3-hydroxymyristoyl] glucosamine N-acyltransferase